MAEGMDLIGVVAIGRNEGVRLERCLDALPDGLNGVIYVDSGSTDGSVKKRKYVSAALPLNRRASFFANL